ncbi:MAG: hypothetical protein C3F06_06150 [Candidatus Methanoperedenaceae archaeon]|nr:MAG: hypothetical protein C3F06_06150 [Candidatus Methanoperedenaceae archaeon]
MNNSKNGKLYKPDLQSVIDGVPECILVIGQDYEVKLMNRAAREFSLKCSGASESQQCYKIFHHREKPCVKHNCPLEEVRKTGQPARIVHEYYNSYGNKLSIEIVSSPLYGTDGTFQGIIQSSRDINIQAEKYLDAAEDEKNRSEAIIAALGDGIIIQDTDYKIIYQNKAQKDSYGDRIGELCYRAYEGNDKICEDCPVEKTFKDGKIHRSERRIPTDKGVSFYELTSSPLKDSKGKIIAGVKVVRDITERKHADEEKNRLLKAISVSTNGITIADKNDRYIYVNTAYADIYGYAQEDFSGETWRKITPTELIPSIEKGLQDTLHNKNIGAFRGEVPGLRKDGTTVTTDVMATALWDAKGSYEGHICIVTDITERKRMEQTLRESEEKYRKLVETLMEGIWVLDKNANTTFVNPRMAQMLGYTVDEMIGKHLFSFMDEKGKIIAMRYLERRMHNVTEQHDFEFLRKDGTRIFTSLETSPINDENGNYSGAIAAIADITERKQNEEELRQSHNLLEAIRNAQSSFIEDSDKRILFDNILHKLISMTQSEYGLIGEILYNAEGNPYLKIIRTITNINSNKDIQDVIEIEDPSGKDFTNLKTLFGQVIISGKPLISNNPSGDKWNGEIPEGHPPLNSFMVIPFYQGKKFVGIACVGNRPGGYNEDLVHYLQPLLNTCASIIEAYKNNQKRKQAEVELRESERFMDSIFESIQDGIGIIDSEMNIIKVNKTAESWYSHAMPLVGKKCYKAYHNRKKRCKQCPAQETLVTGKLAYKVVPKHGPGGKEVGWHEIYSYPLRDSTTGQMKGIIEYVRNITERKLVEEKLRQSEEKYRLLIENIQEGVFVIQDNKMQFVNAAISKMTGYKIEEIIGMDFLHFVAPEDLEMVQDRYSQRQSGEDVPSEYEFHLMCKDGRKIIVSMSVGIVTYRRRIASMGILRDITERKNIEESIKKYNRELEESNHIKELFTDIMHHDLLNPLNVAQGYVEIFLQDETNQKKKSYLETIRRNLLKGMELIENAMKFSKLESMKDIEFEELDLKRIVGEAIDNLTPLAVRAGVNIEKKLDSRMIARANEIIEDIFINIISNAIKYASKGKRIVVDNKDNGSSWIIRIIDFGPGIRDSDKKMIFERFHREEKKGVKGSGLGLAIAGKIIELHKGKIWVEDNPEGGAIFAVEIPKS